MMAIVPVDGMWAQETDMKRPSNGLRRVARACALGLAGWLMAGAWAAPGPPYQATGFKVGEVTDTSAIVWTRLTRNASNG